MNNDLISRSALKKALTEAHINMTLTFDIATFNCVMNTIDNAPTVEITEEQAIDKLHETGWLPNHDKEMTARPHGKWIIDDGLMSCSLCQGIVLKRHFDYCPNCGADMMEDSDE